MSIAIYDPPPGGAAALAPNVSQKVVGIQLNTGNNVSAEVHSTEVHSTEVRPAEVRLTEVLLAEAQSFFNMF
jgi:hypothetical protein